MPAILVTFKLDPETVSTLPASVHYCPGIGSYSTGDPHGSDPAALQDAIASRRRALLKSLADIRPDVLVVGSNAVSRSAIKRWRQCMPPESRLMIVRRGTEIGAIDLRACAEFQITVRNTPGINAPFVAAHIIRHLGLAPGDPLAVIGTGSIGQRVLHAAAGLGIRVTAYSPSSTDAPFPAHFPSSVSFARSIGDAMRGARAVAIAVPWWRGERYNRGIIRSGFLLSAGHSPARIVSCSNPGVFTSAALKLMNGACGTGTMKVRIDTGAEYALRTRVRFPNLDINHDVAFADSECQLALDREVLAQAIVFLETDACAPLSHASRVQGIGP